MSIIFIIDSFTSRVCKAGIYLGKILGDDYFKLLDNQLVDKDYSGIIDNYDSLTDISKVIDNVQKIYPYVTKIVFISDKEMFIGSDYKVDIVYWYPEKSTLKNMRIMYGLEYDSIKNLIEEIMTIKNVCR